MHFAETNVVVLVTPAESIPGRWVAHCLNLDLVTQGNSIQHAVSMAGEALAQVIEDDLAHGLDPLERPPAPQECWDLVSWTLRSGRPVDAIEDPTAVAAVVAQVRVVVRQDMLPEHARPSVVPTVDMLPAPWQVAALRANAANVHC